MKKIYVFRPLLGCLLLSLSLVSCSADPLPEESETSAINKKESTTNGDPTHTTANNVSNNSPTAKDNEVIQNISTVDLYATDEIDPPAKDPDWSKMVSTIVIGGQNEGLLTSPSVDDSISH